jgi:two-component system, OmpR family, heavy metal sensor histidine kinase CusS
MKIRIFPPAWPLGRRLTVLYACALFLLLALSAGFLDWVLRTDLRHDTNQFLVAELQSLQSLMRQRPGDFQAWRDEVEREAASLPGYARYYVRILDDLGQIIAESPGMRNIVISEDFPEPPAVFNGAGANGVDARSRDGRLLLVGVQRVELRRPDVRKALIQIAFDRSHDATVIADWRRKMFIALLVGVLLSITFGFVIAKAGLKPLANITRAFRRISIDDLGTRVNSDDLPPEIADLAAAFDSMLQRLESSFALLTQFSGDLAHELRTPIHNLRGETEVVLGKTRTTEEYRKVLESSLEEYERLSRVIENLLFLARTDTRNAPIRLSSINVRQELEAILDHFEPLAEEKEIAISVTGNALLNADVVLLRRAIANLLSNAFYYTSGRGGVALSVATVDRSVIVTVTDTGVGIEEESLRKVLDRFFRTEKARALHPQGTGLGLAIVKSIMDLHKGRLAIESSPGKGTTVRLIFPT